MFDDHLDPPGHDAGGRQNPEEPGAEKPPTGQRHSADQRRDGQRHDDEGVGRHLRRVWCTQNVPYSNTSGCGQNESQR